LRLQVRRKVESETGLTRALDGNHWRIRTQSQKKSSRKNKKRRE